MKPQGKQLEIQEFVKDATGTVMADDKGNVLVMPISSPSLSPKEDGSAHINFKLSNRDRFLYELYLAQSNSGLSEAQQKEIKAALQDLSVFLKDINCELKPGANKLDTELLYEVVDATPLWFYHNAADPDYVVYSEKLAILNGYRQRSEPIPEDLQAYCTAAEQRFFAGDENVQLRHAYMKKAVSYYINLPSVYMCALATFYPKQELFELLKESKKKPKTKRDNKVTPSHYYKSGHLTDQMLKYTYPGSVGDVPIFDTLQDRTKQRILASDVERETIVEGIKLTPSESKIVDSLCKLLSFKSSNLDFGSEDFLNGNQSIEKVKYGDRDEVAPRLLFTLYELTKEYKGATPNGKDVENVKEILEELAKKSFLVVYKQSVKLPNGNSQTKQIEEFMPLVRIQNYSEREQNAKGQDVYRREAVLLKLNPIFIHQINNKFIKCPPDLNRQTMIAYGSKSVSEAAIRLRDFLMKEKSLKHYTTEIGLEKLQYMLCEKSMKESRRSRVVEFTNKAIDTAKKLGILIKHEIVPLKTQSGDKVIFHINKEWS